MMRRVGSSALLVLVSLLVGGAVAGCGGDEPSEVVSYTDNAGRSCTIDLAEISRTATCDVDPSTLVSCEGTEAAIVLSDDYDFDTMIYTRESCTACVDREAHQTLIVDCATVDCTTDDDCLNRDGDLHPFACSSGVCRRM